MKLGTWIVSVLVALLAQPVAAESTFDREVRLIAEGLKLAKGSVIADIGAGDGKFAIALSPRVGETGKVYATELDEDDREDIESAAADAGVTRVEVTVAQFEATGLPKECCDGVFLSRVYHHLTTPAPFGRSLFETVRPGGRLMIIDFPPSFWLALFTPDGIPEDRGGHGIPPEIMIKELETAGFVKLESIEKWPSSNFVTRNYAVIFERPE